MSREKTQSVINSLRRMIDDQNLPVPTFNGFAVSFAIAELEAALAAPSALPDFVRRDVYQAIESAENPKGMSTHDGKARIGADRLRYMMRVIDGMPVAALAAPVAGRVISDAEIAQAFHEAYEELAPSHGYETRPESRKRWADVPENNRNLMIATVRKVRAIIAKVEGK